MECASAYLCLDFLGLTQFQDGENDISGEPFQCGVYDQVWTVSRITGVEEVWFEPFQHHTF